VLGDLIAQFDVGELTSVKGIAEGISNSNWLIETTGKDGAEAGSGGTRFILTMYEFRIELEDLPFFLSLLDHLSAKGCPVPRTIHDRDGQLFRLLDDKAVALIEFLPGVSVSTPTPEQAHSVGRALAQMQLAAADFLGQRENAMGRAEWQRLANECGAAGLAEIDPGFADLVARELPATIAAWPKDLPRGTIHADLFPDNVLMRGPQVTGLIDFYFACTDLFAYDLAVTHAAWCFSNDGGTFDPALSAALIAGYQEIRPLLPAERAALPLLARGASLRFALTRAWDWVNTPADALVTRKDPLAFARRLEFYADPANAAVFDAA
jgi:homoserine kinase type II